MNTFAAPLHRSWCVIERGIAALQPAGALAARLYIAQVFWLAGLTKIRDWETTLLLFTEEYRVPLLPPAWAAVSGTAGELLLPVLLVLGLGGRLAAPGHAVVAALGGAVLRAAGAVHGRTQLVEHVLVDDDVVEHFFNTMHTRRSTRWCSPSCCTSPS